MNNRLLRSFALGGLVLAALVVGACTPPPPFKHPVPELPKVEVSPLAPVTWDDVDGWQGESPAPVLKVFLAGCKSLKWRAGWADACRDAADIEPWDNGAARQFFESHFQPYEIRNPDGSLTGLITGYYVPDLQGSRVKTERFRYPLYAVPDDLLVIDLSSLYPELGSYRLRGRLEGRRVVPYWSRKEIDGAEKPLAGKEIFWVEDAVELFYLQIQGSGRIHLENGKEILVNYGDQNGHPYRSIGKLLLQRGEMTREQMSMQNIMAWARQHPDRVADLLAENPSYVFFRELPGVESPPGAMGIPLTAGRSLAVDPRVIPLGAPVFLNTTWPSDSLPLKRLMVAQDTGGAIKGAVRADFFWGMGDDAGYYAGHMKQSGRLWVLLPKEVAPPPGS